MTDSTSIAEKEINPKVKPANPMINVDGFKVRQNSIVSVFSDVKKIDPLVKKVRDEALTVPIDLTTKKGRDLIASEAHKVSKMKTGVISKMIDPSIAEAKAIVSSVGKGKTHFKNEMDSLRIEVRKPLTDWEAAEEVKEQERIKAINERISGIHAIATFDPNNPPGKDEIASLMEAVDSINCDEGFDEFTQDALQAKSRVKEVLTEKLNAIIQQELKEKNEEELRVKELEIQKQHIKQQAQERVNKLAMIPVGFFGKSSEEITKKISSLNNYEVPQEEFGDLYETAKTSVENVVMQLNGMLQQQLLVEQAQQQKEVTEEKPVSEKLADRFANTEASEPIAEPIAEVIPEGGRTHSRTVVTPLTPHQHMVKDVNFWAGEYGVVNSEYSDLMNIVNKYKQFFKES